MVRKVCDVVRDIRVALDRNNSSEQLLSTGDVDTLTLDEIIASKIEDAARRVEEIAPAHLLEAGHNFGDAVYWEERGCGWVLLPDDFMRLLSFRMSDWERTVYNVIPVETTAYQMQSSRYKGIRGNVQKPVCAVVNRPEGKALEFYSCKSEDAYVRQAQYLPYPKIDRDGGIDLCERCYTAIVYTAAALVASSLGEQQGASSFFELAKTALQ